MLKELTWWRRYSIWIDLSEVVGELSIFPNFLQQIEQFGDCSSGTQYSGRALSFTKSKSIFNYFFYFHFKKADNKPLAYSITPATGLNVLITTSPYFLAAISFGFKISAGIFSSNETFSNFYERITKKKTKKNKNYEETKKFTNLFHRHWFWVTVSCCIGHILVQAHSNLFPELAFLFVYIYCKIPRHTVCSDVLIVSTVRNCLCMMCNSEI